MSECTDGSLSGADRVMLVMRRESCRVSHGDGCVSAMLVVCVAST